MVAIDSLLKFHVGGHSEVQMDHFITLRAGGTVYGCFLQSLRELSKRVRAVRESHLSLQELLLRIETLRGRTSGDSFQARLNTIRLERLHNRSLELGGVIHSECRELLHFYGQAASLFYALGFDRTPPAPARLRELELERWQHHLRCLIALDLYTTGRPSKATAELLQCMPSKVRHRIAHECLSDSRARSCCIAAYFDYRVTLPPPIQVPLSDLPGLLQCPELQISLAHWPPLSSMGLLPSMQTYIGNDSNSVNLAPADTD
jgi:hypothetical protein